MPLLAAPLPPGSAMPPIDLSRKTNGTQQSIIEVEEETQAVTSRIPTVRLDIQVIDDSIAAKLATSLINHVLFLKSQVPLPIMILNKQRQTNPKADKPRLELLNTLDILSSHLDTTFTALSTAFAKCKSPASTQPAYLAILVGPSISSAKTKVIFGVDGLEAKVWGVRDDLPAEDEDHEDASKESEDAQEADGSESECDSHSGDDLPDDSESESGEEEETSEDEQPPTKQPPLSHSSPSQNPSRRQPHLVSAPPHAEQQQILHRADRHFSNTLARAEGEGRGMSAEMAPTHTHILIRAPRRYTHPAWIPKQNIGKTMDRVLEEFLVDLQGNAPEEKSKKTLKKTNKVEGVWVTARDTHAIAVPSDAPAAVEEDDEMIWWSWDRELVGFN